ncbi:MAG: enoyl-CoA hydratase/isomerase family protein [Actinobacteria bacterium]|nr:MAG: enoyl-CoA hydratase/isomerase family protein [Actinomycetota bacterium]HKN38845.1 enoyl-CoA hydratase/isomerase family protein [Acidimicrobiia bacterium]HKN91320.1 enoyl-CoA hydratase/isomerase family protein [Acidimicrobiia bacterium]HMC79053.1 enoyl-CoA hydratase/isomerase family protein [Acidimicrobiia bacterium]
MADAPVLTTVDGPVGWLTLNRPEAMNAVTVELARELEAGLRRLAGEAAVIVIRGAGGNFSAGGDVAEVDRLRGEGPAALAELFEAFGRALATIAEIDVPVVAAVEGYAMAGGFELLQACDIVIVADDAVIADTHLKFGQIPGGGGSQRLPRLVGRQRAAAHILTGDRLSGAEARAWGLAYQAVPAAELDAATRALAGRLASRSPEALARTKRLLVRGLELPLADGLALERAEVVDHLMSAAGAAAIAAFTGRKS